MLYTSLYVQTVLSMSSLGISSQRYNKQQMTLLSEHCHHKLLECSSTLIGYAKIDRMPGPYCIVLHAFILKLLVPLVYGHCQLDMNTKIHIWIHAIIFYVAWLALPRVEQMGCGRPMVFNMADLARLHRDSGVPYIERFILFRWSKEGVIK